MPFQPGNTLAKGQGRKGYQFEAKQLKEMGQNLDRFLKLLSKITDPKKGINAIELEKFNLSRPVILKIMDKLHANQQYIVGEVGGEFTIVDVPIKSVEEYIKFRKKKEQHKK